MKKAEFIKKWTYGFSDFSRKHFEEDIDKVVQLYADEQSREEAIEFGYGCAFMIDECPSIEDVETVYDKWNKETTKQ